MFGRNKVIPCSFSLVPAAPVFSEVRVRYDQSTGGLKNIMATWNRMVSPTLSVSTACAAVIISECSFLESQ